MNLKSRLKADLKEAMRNKEIVKRDAIRAINTMIKQIEVDQRITLEDADIISLIQKGIKQRDEAIEQYKQANREDLIEKEQAQKDIFLQYMPKQLDDEELKANLEDIIQELGASSMKDMGKVMAQASQKLSSQADGKRISAIVKELLK
jgi:uncharacterized protein YqeY